MNRNNLLSLALVGLMLLAVVSATDTYMTVYTNHKKINVKVSLANFGYFKYGHRLSGRVHVGARYTDWGDQVNKDRYPNQGDRSNPNPIVFQKGPEELDLSGCNNDFQQFNEDYLRNYGAPIYFVERGNCTFTRKARNAAKTGKMLIIADNSEEHDVDKIIMGEDFSGDKVMIPVVMVSKNDAAFIRDYLFEEMTSNNTTDRDNQVWIAIIFNRPHEGEIAAVQYWMIPAEKSSYLFLKNHQHFLDTLLQQKKIDFQPHFVFFRCDDDCKNASKQSEDNMDNFCVFDGQFCNLDPDGKGPLNGVDAVKQSVKELCIYKEFPEYFLTYFFNFHQCYVVKKGVLVTCDAESKQQVIKKFPEAEVKRNFLYVVKACEEDSTYLNPELLENEYNLQTQWGIKFFPALIVNGDIFRGDLKMQEATEEFICEGIEGNNQIDICVEYSRIQDDSDIDGTFTPEELESVNNGGNSHTILIVCIVLFIVFIIGLFVYRRKIRLEVNKELALQVDSAIQQYYTLNESK